MNTNNPGSADPPNETVTHEKSRSVPIRLLLTGLAAVLFALFIGTQVLPVLYAVLFPPSPPLPDNLALTSHTSPEYGSDEWDYSSSQPACELAKFYQDKGGVCLIAPECNPAPPPPASASHVSQCMGQTIFSVFAMRWEASLTPQFNQKTIIHLSRQIFWTGVITPSQDQPEATP